MNAAVAGLESIKRFVSDCRRRSAFRRELAQLDRSGSLDVVLDDLGLTRWEMDKIARGYPEAERLLPMMADRRGIELEKLDPRDLFALRHTCSLCDQNRSCRRWLAGGEAQDAARFCPNAGLFEKLQAPDQGG